LGWPSSRIHESEGIINFLKLGFLDGKEGLIFHSLQGLWYRFLVDAPAYAKATARFWTFERRAGKPNSLAPGKPIPPAPFPMREGGDGKGKERSGGLGRGLGREASKEAMKEAIREVLGVEV
jgi:hypothetical protein